jgi:dTDP-4-dehydrorhamnose reductase
MVPRILVLGSNGQVGWQLQRALAPLGDVIALDRSRADISKPGQIHAIVNESKPRVIVNAAAYTAVDKAEQDSAGAYSANSSGVEELAELAAQQRALLVHYSTDYVFDGENPLAYVETDNPNPLSVYGASKFRGEQAIIDSGCEHLIFRTSWVFATRGSNFIKTMLRLASERTELRVVADQWGAPTSAELIADVTAHAIRDVLSQRAPGGLYHLTASGKTSWHEYANFILEQAQQYGADLRTYSSKGISTAEYPLPAKRPANSLLDTTKLQNAFQLSLPDWRHHVQRTVSELLNSK